MTNIFKTRENDLFLAEEAENERDSFVEWIWLDEYGVMAWIILGVNTRTHCSSWTRWSGASRSCLREDVSCVVLSGETQYGRYMTLFEINHEMLATITLMLPAIRVVPWLDVWSSGIQSLRVSGNIA